MSKQELSPLVPEHPHPQQRAWEARTQKLRQHNIPQEVPALYSQREQVLASDKKKKKKKKKRTCFANNPSDLKGRVETEVSVWASAQLGPDSEVLVKWGVLADEGRAGGPVVLSPRRTSPLRPTPHPRSGLHRVVLPEPGASLK